jgi:hypothetical protein
MTQAIDWSEFDAANGELALSELERTSPAHVEAAKKLLKQGATDKEILTRFMTAFPTWEGHQNYLRLALGYLRGLGE